MLRIVTTVGIALLVSLTGVISLGYAEVVEGGLYRESTAPEVYLIQGKNKIWIPTPDALFAMGHNWEKVKVVASGTLNNYTRFNIPSYSPTPGSLIFPPNRSSHWPLEALPNTTTVTSQGKTIQLGELYGWLRMVDSDCAWSDGEDFHYSLEVDTDRAIEQGIDLNLLLRVGNVVFGIPHQPGLSPRKAVSLPLIGIELNAWGWHGHRPLNTKPSDWTLTTNWAGGCASMVWPFDPHKPHASKESISPLQVDANKRGPYVRVGGSLITDSPHDVQHRVWTFFSRHFAITTDSMSEWEGSVPDWHPGIDSSDPRHNARWTEIHPPDFIEVLDSKVPRVTTRAIALAARAGKLPFGWSNSCEAAEFDMFPEASRPGSSQVAFQELRGPESYFPWGENHENGSWVTAYDDRIRVKARVCGGAIGGSPGRFKAIYRVWWEQKPPDQLRRYGSFVTSDGDEIRYEIIPAAIGPEAVEFQLCLKEGLTWEKKMKIPGVELMVKDQRRCDSNGLWTHEVGGQTFTFHKSKGIWGMKHVHNLPITDLGTITPGTRVVFTWIKD